MAELNMIGQKLIMSDDEMTRLGYLALDGGKREIIDGKTIGDLVEYADDFRRKAVEAYIDRDESKLPAGISKEDGQKFLNSPSMKAGFERLAAKYFVMKVQEQENLGPYNDELSKIQKLSNGYGRKKYGLALDQLIGKNDEPTKKVLGVLGNEWMGMQQDIMPGMRKIINANIDKEGNQHLKDVGTRPGQRGPICFDDVAAIGPMLKIAKIPFHTVRCKSLTLNQYEFSGHHMILLGSGNVVETTAKPEEAYCTVTATSNRNDTGMPPFEALENGGVIVAFSEKSHMPVSYATVDPIGPINTVAYRYVLAVAKESGNNPRLVAEALQAANKQIVDGKITDPKIEKFARKDIEDIAEKDEVEVQRPDVKVSAERGKVAKQK